MTALPRHRLELEEREIRRHEERRGRRHAFECYEHGAGGADATAAATDDMLNATLRTVYRSFGDVRPTADLPELFDRSRDEP